MTEIRQPHDRFFKEVFARSEIAQEFLHYYLPAHVALFRAGGAFDAAKLFDPARIVSIAQAFSAQRRRQLAYLEVIGSPIVRRRTGQPAEDADQTITCQMDYATASTQVDFDYRGAPRAIPHRTP